MRTGISHHAGMGKPVVLHHVMVANRAAKLQIAVPAKQHIVLTKVNRFVMNPIESQDIGRSVRRKRFVPRMVANIALNQVTRGKIVAGIKQPKRHVVSAVIPHPRRGIMHHAIVDPIELRTIVHGERRKVSNVGAAAAKITARDFAVGDVLKAWAAVSVRAVDPENLYPGGVRQGNRAIVGTAPVNDRPFTWIIGDDNGAGGRAIQRYQTDARGHAVARVIVNPPANIHHVSRMQSGFGAIVDVRERPPRPIRAADKSGGRARP